MKPDLDQFMPHIEDFELSDQQKREFLTEMWKIIEVFVDLGFGVEATQNILFAQQKNTGIKSSKSLRSKFNQKAKKPSKLTPEKGGLHYEP